MVLLCSWREGGGVEGGGGGGGEGGSFFLHVTCDLGSSD